MTKVLLNLELEKKHLDQIRSAASGVDLVYTTDRSEALEAFPHVQAAFLWQRIRPEEFERARLLRWVHAWGAGAEHFLFKEFVESDVALTTGKGTAGSHVSEQAMALLLGLTRGVARAGRTQTWTQRGPIRKVVWELAGRTMGIVGLGGNGKALAKRAHAFGMRILAVDTEDVEVPDYVEACWKPDCFYDLLGESDVVAICLPYTPATKGLFNREAFARMQPHALLINVTRGKIVDEAALVDALENHRIGGAGLDTVPQEPLPDGHPLWRMDNVLITPHVGGGSPYRQDVIVERFCENLQRFVTGQPLLGLIDKRKGY